MQDEQFDYIDQGWAAMKETLDREMPVERRRRAIWWWFPVGIGALLLLGWAVWTRTPAAKTNHPDPVAQTDDRSQVMETPKPTKSGTGLPQKNSESGEQPSPPIPSTSTAASSAADLTNVDRPFTEELPFLPSRTSALSYAVPQPQLVSDIDLTIRRDLPVPLAHVPAKFASLAAKQSDTPVAVLHFKARTPWQLWAEAGTHHEGTHWLSGGQGGILLRKPIGKWQFQTGLSLGMRQLAYERGTEFVSFSQSEQDSPTNPDVGLGNPNNVQASLPADLSLLATQLRLQASLQRTFGDHWRAGLGIGASYWVDARRQWTYAPGATFEPTQESRDFVNQFSGSNGQRVTETAFRSFGLSASAGVEYQFGPRWAAGLDYNFGLTNHSLVDGFVMYDRYGQVSIRYRIK